MSQEALYTHTREAAQRFEYFLLGISIALCAFEGQTLKPEKLGWNGYTFQVASVIALVVSIVFGFLRVQAMIATSGLNAEIFERQTKRIRLLKGESMFDNTTGQPPNEFQRHYTATELNREIEIFQKHLDSARRADHRWFLWQKGGLALGFGGLLLTKIVTPYL